MGTGVGHDITAMVDNSPHHTYNLNSMFIPEVGDYKRGKIMLPLNRLEPGALEMIAKAWELAGILVDEKL